MLTATFFFAKVFIYLKGHFTAGHPVLEKEDLDRTSHLVWVIYLQIQFRT